MEIEDWLVLIVEDDGAVVKPNLHRITRILISPFFVLVQDVGTEMSLFKRPVFLVRVERGDVLRCRSPFTRIGCSSKHSEYNRDLELLLYWPSLAHSSSSCPLMSSYLTALPKNKLAVGPPAFYQSN